MNDITTISTGEAMPSRDIAELSDMQVQLHGGEGVPTSGDTHHNVLKTIRSLAERGLVSGNDTPGVHPQSGQTTAYLAGLMAAAELCGALSEMDYPPEQRNAFAGCEMAILSLACYATGNTADG